ncbi:MAG TPA: glycosyltransferase 87 family protein [Candidatus Limnocylindria bacterium]|nr:glycosyltransferase 87 family protein [Candidatus Limnocylindria bacterium]
MRPGAARDPANHDRRADRAYLATVALSLVALVALGALSRRIELIGADDFSRIWAGPRAVLTGADPYDPARWPATAVALGTQAPDTAVFIYPPWVTVALLPLAALPLPVASGVWLGASLLAGIAGLRALAAAYLPARPRAHAVVAAMLLLSWVGALTLVIGQWGVLLVGALSAVVLALRAGHPARAGLAAVALVAKPQLFILAAPALAVHVLWPERGRTIPPAGRRFVTAAVGAAAALVAVAWVVLPSWWPTWIREIGGQQLQPTSDTVPALLLVVAGPTGLAAAPLALAALVALGLCFHPRGEAWLPVWLALSSAVAPYTNSYDQIILVVPIVIAAGIAARISPARGWLVLGLGALVLLVATPLLYEVALRRRSETLGALVPLAAVALIAGGLWPVRRDAGGVALR